MEGAVTCSGSVVRAGLGRVDSALTLAWIRPSFLLTSAPVPCVQSLKTSKPCTAEAYSRAHTIDTRKEEL